MKNNDINIELRSEKIRNVIGSMPSSIIRNGIWLLIILYILFFLSICMVRYPESISTEVEVVKNNSGTQLKAKLPYQYISQIDNIISIRIKIEDAPFQHYGMINATISKIGRKAIRSNGQDFFLVEMKPTSYPASIQLLKGMKGEAFLLVSNSTIVDKLLHNMNL